MSGEVERMKRITCLEEGEFAARTIGYRSKRTLVTLRGYVGLVNGVIAEIEGWVEAGMQVLPIHKSRYIHNMHSLSTRVDFLLEYVVGLREDSDMVTAVSKLRTEVYEVDNYYHDLLTGEQKEEFSEDESSDGLDG